MKKKMMMTIIFLLSISTLSMSTLWIAGAQEIVWNTNPTPLPIPLEDHAVVANNGKIYVIGGWFTERRDTVYFADILPNGMVGTWISTASLPEVRVDFKAVVWKDFIYAIGGSTTPLAYRNTVFRAQIQPNGSLGNWETMTELLEPIASHAAVVWNDRIYVIGGFAYGDWKNKVLYAEINPDGSLGSWIQTTPLLEPRRSPAALVYNGVIYVIGGQYQSQVYHSTVYYASINPDGSVGSWLTTNPIPLSVEQEEAISCYGKIYVIGGGPAGIDQEFANVFSATVNSDGTVGSWNAENSLPEPRAAHASVVSEGIIYVLGGTRGDAIKDTIYYSSLLTLPAAVDIDPDALNLRSKGQWITSYIELPAAYNANDINASSILLNETVSAEPRPTAIGDFDDDAISDLMVKFDRAQVISHILDHVDLEELAKARVMTVTLTITGKLNDGTPFQGSDAIKIICTIPQKI